MRVHSGEKPHICEECRKVRTRSIIPAHEINDDCRSHLQILARLLGTDARIPDVALIAAQLKAAARLSPVEPH